VKACVKQSYRGGYHTPLRDQEQAAHHLKCLCTNPCTLRSKTEEMEFPVQSYSYNVIGITVTRWESSRDWSPGLDSSDHKERQIE